MAFLGRYCLNMRRRPTCESPTIGAKHTGKFKFGKIGRNGDLFITTNITCTHNACCHEISINPGRSLAEERVYQLGAFMSVTKDKILVAEDSAPNRTILVHLLKKLGFDVVECVDGNSAWAELQKPDCNVTAILSDIMMPGMDGIQLLEKCRQHEKYKTIPFVLVTAVSDKNYIVNAKAHNVNGYILKPVTFQRVTAKLEEIFPNKKLPKLAG